MRAPSTKTGFLLLGDGEEENRAPRRKPPVVMAAARAARTVTGIPEFIIAGCAAWSEAGSGGQGFQSELQMRLAGSSTKFLLLLSPGVYALPSALKTAITLAAHKAVHAAAAVELITAVAAALL